MGGRDGATLVSAGQGRAEWCSIGLLSAGMAGKGWVMQRGACYDRTVQTEQCVVG